MNNSSSLSAFCFAGSLNDTCIGSKASGWGSRYLPQKSPFWELPCKNQENF